MHFYFINFFLPANINAQGPKEAYHYEDTSYFPCFEEEISVVIDYNEFFNGRTFHWNVLKAEAIGETTGYRYIIMDTLNTRDDDYNGTHNYRIIGPKGKKAFFRLIANNNHYDLDTYCD